MKVVLLGLGSRGDVLPLVALGTALRREGYAVCLATTDDHVGLGAPADVDLVSVAPGMTLADSDELAGEANRALFESSTGTLTALRALMNELAAPMSATLDALVEPGDLVLTGVLGAGMACALISTRECRAAHVTYAATIPTAHGESYISAALPGRVTVVNRWVSLAAHRFFMGLTVPPGRSLAERHGQDTTGGQVHRALLTMPTLVATSALLAPPAPDWPDQVVVTGAWLDPTPELDPMTPGVNESMRELEGFLSAGPAPVYVGLGSAVSRDAAADLRIFAVAAHQAGVRAVIRRSDWLATGGASEMARHFGEHVHVVGTVPHDWLFPQVAAAVHHGGAGTTMAGLRAGIPASVIWHNVDQPFHARRLAELGVGPLGFAKRRLTVDRLATLLGELTKGRSSPAYQEAARSLAPQVRAEHGTAAARDALWRWGLL